MTRHTFPNVPILISVVACLGLAFGCGDKKKDDDTTTSSGSGASNGSDTSSGSKPATGTLNVAGTLAIAAGLTDAASMTIVSYPLDNGAPTSQNAKAVTESPVAADGSFSITIGKTETTTSDTVLAIVGSDGKFVNFVGLPAGDASDATDDRNLLNLPLIDGVDAKLETGLVTTDPEHPDAKAEKSAQESAAALGVTTEKVTQDADTGAVLRTVKNLLNNCDRTNDGRCIDVQTTHEWGGAITTAIDAWSEPKVFAYAGYSFIINFMNTSYKFSDVCKDGNPITLSLFPPSKIDGTSNQTGAISVTPTDGITNKGLTIAKSNGAGGSQCEPAAGVTSTAYIGESGTRFNFIPFSGASFTDKIPKGDWTLTVEGSGGLSEGYKFDLASASPIDSKGIARVWTPAVKITTDATTHIVTKVEVKFYTYSAKGEWVEAVDTSALLAAIGGEGEDDNSSAGGISLMFDDNGQSARVSEHARLKPVTGSNVFTASGFKDDWHLPLAENQTRAAATNYSGIRLTYTLRGTQINFNMD